MTYFETPNDYYAYIAGISVEEYEAREDAIVADLEELDALGRPDLDPEDRDYVADPDFWEGRADDLDWADLDFILDWESRGE